MAQTISRWLLVALILCLGFGQLLRYEVTLGTFYVHDILVLSIITLQGRTLKGDHMPAGFKWIILGLTLGWLRALTLYPLSVLLIPSLYTLRLLAYLALYLILRNSKFTIHHTYFLLAGLITLGIGILQYLLLPDMRMFQYLGWDDHLNRLTLPHFDPTFTAAMLALPLLLSIRLKSYLPTILLSCAILLTYSRSIWLALVVTVCSFMIKNRQYARLIIGSCLLIIPLLFLPKKFGEGTNLLRTYSITSRLEADLSYIQKYRWDLLTGRGLNTMMLDAELSEYPNHASGPNNSYLYLLATTGVMGLIGMLKVIKQLYTSTPHKSLIIFVLIASLFNNVLLYPFVLLWILLLSIKAPIST